MRIALTGLLIFCGFPGLLGALGDSTDNEMPTWDEAIQHLKVIDPTWTEPELTLIPVSKPSRPHTYPFLAYFMDPPQYYGQGVILDPYTIMTDGRLGAVGTIFPKVNFNIVVIAGDPDWSNKTNRHIQTREICSAVRHPEYNHNKTHHSYQLIQLCDPFVFNNYVNAIQIAPPGYTSTGDCIVVSYGRLTVAGKEAGHQREMVVKEVNIKHCPNTVPDPTIICTSKGFCDWDDGGPLICNSDGKAILYGVLTPRWTPPDSTAQCGAPSASASMPNLDRDWFRKEIENAQSSPCEKITTNSGQTSKISNGETPRPHSYPFIAVFKIYHPSSTNLTNVYICFGVIIDTATIITTSKCGMEIKKVEMMRIRVQAGSHDLREKEKSQQSRRICRTTSIGDFTVVHLNDPFVFNEYVKPIWLVNPQSPMEISPTKCTVAGWGRGNTVDGSSTDAFTILQHKEVEILPSSEWTGSPHNLKSAVVTSPGLCKYDFGVPLVCAPYDREYVLGLGEPDDSKDCANNKASLFISLASLDRNKLAQEMIDGAKECRPVPQQAAGL